MKTFNQLSTTNQALLKLPSCSDIFIIYIISLKQINRFINIADIIFYIQFKADLAGITI